MLNVRKKYFCSFKELFHVNFSSNFCKYINEWFSRYSQICSVLLFKKMKKWEWSRSVLEQAKFYAEWNNYFCAVCKGNFFMSYPKGGISFSPRSMNIRTFAKVLILTTRVCLPLVLRNNLSFNAYNFGLTRDENAGTKTIKYLHFDWSTFWWCNLCIFWINGKNLKTANSKMVFWDSLQKTLTYSCFRLNG